MSIGVDRVYEAFLARVNSDEWAIPEDIEMAKQDWRKLLDIAIFNFRFPRVSLDIGENGSFIDENLGMREVQVLAVLMKLEWIGRCIASWEEIRLFYSNKDFSQANHLDKLIKAKRQIEIECEKAQGTYTRSIDGKPSPDYRELAGM